MQQLLVLAAASREPLVLLLLFGRVRVRDWSILILQQADLLTIDPRTEEVHLFLIEGSDQIIEDDVTLTRVPRVCQLCAGPRATVLLRLLTATHHLRLRRLHRILAVNLSTRVLLAGRRRHEAIELPSKHVHIGVAADNLILLW